MPTVRQLHLVASDNYLAWAAVALVIAGAVNFGIASCGGHVWHKEFFLFFASAVAVAAAIVPSRVLRSRRRKAVFLVGLAAAYFIVEAATAPFYPAPPRSITEYAGLLLQALQFGPCG
jgi:hypothetical protein